MLGLTDEEAAERRRRGQGNALRLPPSVSLWRILRRNALTVLNGILFGISLVLVALGLLLDAAFTALPILLNVVVGMGQEVSAKRKLDRLALIARPTATVIRGGAERSVDPAELVLGDVVLLRRGDQAVVDGVIVEGRLELDEALLSGESEPVARGAGEPVLSGSVCVAGGAAVETTRVGAATFSNRLALRARAFRDERTPLQHDIDRAIAAVAVLTVAVAIPAGLEFHHHGGLLSPAAVQAAAVLVAIVPQGLAIMITVTYAAAAVAISRAGAIVQRINAVESMSRVDTLCLDKTGTLTTQRIVLDELIPIAVSRPQVERQLARLAASVSAPDRTTRAIAAALPGHPTPPADEVPFSSARRWSGLTFERQAGLETVDAEAGDYVLGAPEIVGPAAQLEERWSRTIAERAEEGARVLLFARAPSSAGPARGLRDNDAEPRLPDGLQVQAILVLREELRPDARATLDALAAAGVELRLISGDDVATVTALARRAGLPGLAGASGPSGRGVPPSRLVAVSGQDLEPLDDAALAGHVARTIVFGRVDPETKARLVQALRSLGHYVAMVGDGVNDVLSLKRANLGIAMQSGSAATRAVADLVLADDRFAVLPLAVREGQRVVTAMVSAVDLLLARTFTLLLVVAACGLLGLPFPLTPRLNAVLALVTVGLPILVLAVWARPDRAPPSILRLTLRFSIPAALAMAALAVPIYLWYLPGPLPLARTALVTSTVFMGVALIPFLASPFESEPGPTGLGGDWRPTVLAFAMLALYGAIAATEFGRGLFGLALLPAGDIAALLAVTVVWMAAITLVRASGVAGVVLRPWLS